MSKTSISSSPVRAAFFCASLAGAVACGARSQVVATNPGLSLSPTCADAVQVFPDYTRVNYDYYEVALIRTEGNSVYTGNGDLLRVMRNRAAELGANGVIVGPLGAT